MYVKKSQMQHYIIFGAILLVLGVLWAGNSVVTAFKIPEDHFAYKILTENPLAKPQTDANKNLIAQKESNAALAESNAALQEENANLTEKNDRLTNSISNYDKLYFKLTDNGLDAFPYAVINASDFKSLPKDIKDIISKVDKKRINWKNDLGINKNNSRWLYFGEISTNKLTGEQLKNIGKK